jgi:acyl-CoA dehydrogenase
MNAVAVDAAMPEVTIDDDLRWGIRRLCKDFPDEYWRKVDEERAYPDSFVQAVTAAGYLGLLIPVQYGGLGLGITQASIVVEEINASGGNAAAVHAQMYTMGTVLRHGSEEQRNEFLPRIASGELRLQAFAVTEPSAGTDTTRTRTSAVREGDRYVVNGQKVFISRVQHSDLMILLARTTPYDDVEKKTDGMSVFIVDLRDAKGVTVRPIPTMMNHETNEVFLDNVEVPAKNLVGEEGKGFRYILEGMNAERVLMAAECIGDAHYLIGRAARYASERVVFGRPIGQNQGVQFPIAQAHIKTEAADLMRWRAASLFDGHQSCGPEANMAKLLAADASWEAANVAVQTLGGYGFAVEYDVERKLRETRLYQVAPISTNLILSYIGEHVLKMPRSY